jgi:parvulin-like peptidyl-prolyl isomerase
MATRVVLKRVQVDTTGVQDFVKQRQARGEATEHDNLSQIVLAKPAAGATEAERNSIQGEALKIVRTATGDPTQFAALARKHSIDTAGAEVGGYMGWVDPQGLLPELRGQLAGMKPGDISPPIATTQGLHILLLHARRDARDLLFSQRFADERNRLVKEQRQQANIKLYDLEGNPLQVKAEDLATSATAER